MRRSFARAGKINTIAYRADAASAQTVCSFRVNLRELIGRKSPIAAVMGDSSTIAFGQIAAEESADEDTADANDHERDSNCYVASEVGKEEKPDSCVHQNCQQNS
jgi:hypothetical protein